MLWPVEDIEKMKTDAEAHAADDEKRRGLVEVRNIAEQAIYAAEKAVKDNGDKVGVEIIKEVQDAIEALKTAKGSEDVATIKGATDTLSTTLSKIGEAMMKAQPETPPAAPSAPRRPVAIVLLCLLCAGGALGGALAYTQGACVGGRFRGARVLLLLVLPLRRW